MSLLVSFVPQIYPNTVLLQFLPSISPQSFLFLTFLLLALSCSALSPDLFISCHLSLTIRLTVFSIYLHSRQVVFSYSSLTGVQTGDPFPPVEYPTSLKCMRSAALPLQCWPGQYLAGLQAHTLWSCL